MARRATTLDIPMPEPDRILISVAWPYASGPRHIGHVAGYGVPSDVFARYQRLRGADVLMVSGTDDHGTPITYGADKEGISPRQFADRYNRVIVEDQLKLGLAYDCFTRTYTQNHYRVTQDLFTQLHDKGYLFIKKQLGAISPSTGRTLPDRFIEGTCPICGYREARGDQCDNCGNQLDPTDLIDPHSRVNGEVPEFRETEHFFFDLPAFGNRLQEWIARQEHWRPNVRAFSRNFVNELKPRAITRDLDWGVPIPLDGWRDRDDKRIYVWDFLSRYDPDALRYFLTIAGPETQDTDFTWAEFVRRNNDELVGTWGNLVHRTLVNAHRNFGAVPPAGALSDRDQQVLSAVAAGFETVGDPLGRARFKAAIGEAMRLAALVNQYLGEEQPWHLVKNDRERAGTVLNVALPC